MKCLVCGKTIPAQQDGCCSPECYAKGLFDGIYEPGKKQVVLAAMRNGTYKPKAVQKRVNGIYVPKRQANRHCIICGELLKPVQTKYCSECSEKMRDKVKKNCPICGKEFIGGVHKKYCSGECKKIGLARLKENMNEEYKNN